MRSYSFESANKGTVEFTVTGRYRGSRAKDISVEAEGIYRDFEEADDAEEIFAWLIAQGVRFQSKRSLYCNYYTVQCEMIDGERTFYEVLEKAEAASDEEIDELATGRLGYEG